MPKWNAEQYLKFKTERTQPAVDLAARIPLDKPKKILDIGCGPGNSTEILFKRYPDAYILGIDSSEEMITAARRQYPQLEFALRDAGNELETLEQDFDVVFSNACIQWIPEHRKLLANMLGRLKKGGILAVQTPFNDQEPIHRVIQQTVIEPQWMQYFKHPRVFYNLTQEEYFDFLCRHTETFDIWETTYLHKLNSYEDIMQWYRGTGLKPYLEALDADKQEQFEAEILRKLKQEYTVQNSGKIIFRFPRLFFTAVR